MLNQRKVALDALISVCKDYGYSNLVLQKTFCDQNVSPSDRPFITTLFYGVLDRMITLDYVISRFVTKPVEKITPITLFSLRLAIFQILFLDKVPYSAAVNESVKLVKNSKEKYNAAFVNAVLRNFLRADVKLPEGNAVNTLKIKYSCPEWIIDSLISDYGIDETINILKHFLTAPNITVRINSTIIADNEFIGSLKNSGIDAKLLELPHAAVICNGVEIKSLYEYADGYFYVQDIPSQTAVLRLGINRGDSVLDLCASPGGKSFLAAQNAGKGSIVTACDNLENRVDLIKKGAQRLKLDNIKCLLNDARVFNEELGLYDKVICDVPCSGLGVIRRKPEIKYKTDLDFDELKSTQLAILQNGLKYLKNGGRLMYSTCTLRRAENELIVRELLDKHSDFELEYEHTFLPGRDKTDGFYYAIIKCR